MQGLCIIIHYSMLCNVLLWYIVVKIISLCFMNILICGHSLWLKLQRTIRFGRRVLYRCYLATPCSPPSLRSSFNGSWTLCCILGFPPCGMAWQRTGQGSQSRWLCGSSQTTTFGLCLALSSTLSSCIILLTPENFSFRCSFHEEFVVFSVIDRLGYTCLVFNSSIFGPFYVISQKQTLWSGFNMHHDQDVWRSSCKAFVIVVF